MQKYNVGGMSCAACQARVEKAVSKVPGVTECSVSLLTNSMGVEGNADSEKIISAVEKAGYTASLAENNSTEVEENKTDPLEDKETGILLKRLISSSIFLLLLMYISMGHMMWNWPLPAFFIDNHVAMGLVEMILSTIILIINKKFFISGFRSVLHGSSNMDTLVALGSGISYVYSVVMLFGMTDAVVNGDSNRVMHFMDNFYFESAAMILTLITIGKTLEAKSKGKTTNALKSLMKLAPKTAVLVVDNEEKEVPVSQVHKGDFFVVHPGANIPVDGIVVEGSSAVNEASLTGESVPVDKAAGATVSAGTSNVNGFIKCQATRVGEDTTISQIIKMVSDAAATKAPIAKIADKVSGVFVPVVLIISLITFVVWLLCGADFPFSLSRAVCVLVVSCPCALGLATPVAIMVGNGVGAKNGILFKNSVSLENAGKIQIVALDKTGTITKGKPEVVEVIPFEKDSVYLEQFAYSLEKKSEHPLGKAVVSYCENKGISYFNIDDFEAVGGRGVKGSLQIENEVVQAFGGNLAFIKENCPSLCEEANLEEEILNISKRGQTPLVFAEIKVSVPKLVGIIAVSDVIKEDSERAITELKDMGIHVVMLTGDNEIVAKTIGEKAGVDEIIAGVLPAGKELAIVELSKKGKVCMVGDGVNDAPALTRANIGIAIGAGADVAIDAADIVLVKNHLEDVPAAIKLSRKTLVNIKENLFWAFFYNIILIPVAAGVYHKLLGIDMNPMLGAAAMSLSSFCVVSNALRLNLINIRKPSGTKRSKLNIKETYMEKIIKVEGMMCEHCEARVKEALEKIKGIESAVPDHVSGEVKLTLSKEVKDKELDKVINKAGYKFIQ